MTQNRRIVLNIVATYGRSLYALVLGLFCGRWTLMALGQVDYGLMGGHEKADIQIARMCVEYRNQGVCPVDFDGIADGCDCVSWQG